MNKLSHTPFSKYLNDVYVWNNFLKVERVGQSNVLFVTLLAIAKLSSMEIISTYNLINHM